MSCHSTRMSCHSTRTQSYISSCCLCQVLRGEPYSEKCDIWSFGVVLWELMQRQRPYADCHAPLFLLLALSDGTCRLPPLSPDEFTPGLAQLLERCLSPMAADRPCFKEILKLLYIEYKIVHDRAEGDHSTAHTALCARSFMTVMLPSHAIP
jgi:serine/threonine protein kinase